MPNVFVRVGRTGRMGREGKAVTYFTDDDAPFLKMQVVRRSLYEFVLYIDVMTQDCKCHSAIGFICTRMDTQTTKTLEDEATGDGQGQAHGYS